MFAPCAGGMVPMDICVAAVAAASCAGLLPTSASNVGRLSDGRSLGSKSRGSDPV